MKTVYNHKGQSTVEYAVLWLLVIAALICMFSYATRAVQGKFKTGADAISKRQYAVGRTSIVGR